MRATYHLIDMPLFAFPAYLKILKHMRKPGHPQEENTREACGKNPQQKTNIAPQWEMCKRNSTLTPTAYLHKAVTPWAKDAGFYITGG